jgi:hypothetical protein
LRHSLSGIGQLVEHSGGDIAEYLLAVQGCFDLRCERLVDGFLFRLRAGLVRGIEEEGGDGEFRIDVRNVVGGPEQEVFVLRPSRCGPEVLSQEAIEEASGVVVSLVEVGDFVEEFGFSGAAFVIGEGGTGGTSVIGLVGFPVLSELDDVLEEADGWGWFVAVCNEGFDAASGDGAVEADAHGCGAVAHDLVELFEGGFGDSRGHLLSTLA